jgi:hypothetical protein
VILFDAPILASGKSLLARINVYIATGRDACMMTHSGDPNEERKALMAVLLNGDAVLILDNISRPLEGDTLCLVLTSPFFQDRMLGKNSADAKLIAPTCSTFLGTGNMTAAASARTQRGHGEMSKSKSSRKRIEQKIWRLMAIAIPFGVKVESMDHLAGFTAGELEAYHCNLDWLLKERIIAMHPELGSRLHVPDHLEAWEWLERLN